MRSIVAVVAIIALAAGLGCGDNSRSSTSPTSTSIAPPPPPPPPPQPPRIVEVLTVRRVNSSRSYWRVNGTISPNRKTFEARKRDTAALGARSSSCCRPPLRDSARCCRTLFTASDTVTFICELETRRTIVCGGSVRRIRPSKNRTMLFGEDIPDEQQKTFSILIPKSDTTQASSYTLEVTNYMNGSDVVQECSGCGSRPW